MLWANVASTLIKSGENRVRGGISVGVKEIFSSQPVNYLHNPSKMPWLMWQLWL
ncbi:MAG: hypothetical protein F6J90_26810 [Moorea sp. SIOASIH]|nr:hypothetical protein [Moorena sp. SIOASIH]NEO93219.1 hypothetical protein [Moorena sp. SIO3G5]